MESSVNTLGNTVALRFDRRELVFLFANSVLVEATVDRVVAKIGSNSVFSVLQEIFKVSRQIDFISHLKFVGKCVVMCALGK